MKSTRKKILVFSDWFLPGFKAGGPIRSLYHITQNVDHEFFVVTRNTDYHSTTIYSEVESNGWNELSKNCKVYYLSEANFTNNQIERFLDEIKPDWIYLNSLFSPVFTIKPLFIAKKRKLLSKVIVAPRGMLKSGALSIKSKKKRIFISVANFLGWYKNVRWHATNSQEEDEIKSKFGRNAIVFQAPVLSSIGPHEIVRKQKRIGEVNLISLSRISPEKGIKEAIEFVSELPNEYSVLLDVYGAIPNSEYAQECIELARKSKHKISLKGEVNPNQISDILQNYHFFMLPTWGENFGHAIAEALVNGVPVIISDRTPWKDLEAEKAGWAVTLTKESFIHALTLAISMEESVYNDWVDGAKAYGSERTNSPEARRLNEILFE